MALSTDKLMKQLFRNIILGDVSVRVRVEVQIMSTYRTMVHFWYYGKPFTFDITKWQTRGQAQLYAAFHSISRDPVEFGSIRGDDFAINFEQKLNIVQAAVEDVFICLNQILLKHELSVIDYAIWYRERRRPGAGHLDDEITYGTYITKITCDCILQTSFMAGNVNYEVVEFNVISRNL